VSEADLDARKAEARRLARAKRLAAADPDAARQIVKTFPEALAKAGAVAGYWPIGSEIDCRPLLASLAARGVAIALPRMDTRAEPPSFRAWRDGDELAADAFGVMAPLPAAPMIEPRVLLVPLLAFDRAGRRLGQGGGHYDRVLEALRPRGVIAAGLAYAAQEIVEVPSGAHDERLDWIVTEREAIRARR
jgi:5-formyltetrahydrofolate cyclo-ligase